MDVAIKKCPMCAEQIPLDATVCEYCGTKFEVTVEAGQAVSRVLEEAVAPPPAQPIPPPMPAAAPKQVSPWVWIAAGLGLLLIIAVVGGGVLIAQDGLPFLATPTNTPSPTSTPNYAVTQQAKDRQATAAAQPAWVREFSRPILDNIQNLQPNFEDDFFDPNGRLDRWSDLGQGVEFTEGVLRIVKTDGWAQAGGPLDASDFVLDFDVTPQILDGSATFGVDFRVGKGDWLYLAFDPINDSPDRSANIGLYMNEKWIENISENKFGVEAGKTIHITLIARGEEYGLFINRMPFSYARDNRILSNTWCHLWVYSGSGYSKVDFDNVKFWDLNNLLP